MQKTYRYLDLITGLFITVLLVSNVTSSKILIFGPFTFDGGTILFPLSYMFGDILTEVYGYARSRRVIWMGFAMIILAALVFIIVGKLPPAPDWGGQDAYQAILGLTPRIVTASVIAYFCGEFLNSFILAKLKIATAGRWLWLRTIGSTLIGQGADTFIFVAIAFWGVLPSSLLTTIIISNYIFKVGIEVVCTPLTYWITRKIKQREEEDYYDRGTKFNPFVLSSAQEGQPTQPVNR